MLLKRLAKGLLYGCGLTPSEVFQKFSGKKHSSFAGEEEVIARYLSTLLPPDQRPFVVDIAAGDGVFLSNTLELFKGGARGIAVEYDAAKFRNLTFAYSGFEGVSLFRTKAFPSNVLSLLEAGLAPKDFAFLNLDIDSYDYFILDRLLASYRPLLICAEINEIIPPPLKFTVLFDPDHGWNSGDHFHGQSISKLFELCEKYEYDLVHLLFNNAFLIPREKNTFPALDPATAYREGYRDRPGRAEMFKRAVPYEPLFDMSPGDAKNFLHDLFRAYKGKYELE